MTTQAVAHSLITTHTCHDCMRKKVKSLSRVGLFATPRTVAYQAPPSMEFSRQEHWSGLPCPSPRRERENGKGSRSVVSDSVRQRGLRPTGLLPGSSVHGIFRARGLEWGAVAFSEYETTIIPILFFRITVLFVS